MKIIPVILAGGIGERFWPMSRQKRPKQLISIISNRTMIEETLLRARPFCTDGVRPLIVTGKNIAGPLRRVLSGKCRFDCIVEPVGKNTAPAIAAAAAWIREKYGDAVMVVLPADHAIQPAKLFVKAVRRAASLADASDCLCLFGIRPTRPDTGYGYVQVGDALDDASDVRVHPVRRFVEKPGDALAKKYCASGDYFWNSGMFVWKASVILNEIKTYMPDLYRQVQSLMNQKITASRLNTFYTACAKESIDYGIMEKSRCVMAICPSFVWDDVGSWESLERIHGRTEDGATVVGRRVVSFDSPGSIVVNASQLSVVSCGTKDTVVVVTDDAVLVISRDKLPQIRTYLTALKGNRSLPRSIY